MTLGLTLLQITSEEFISPREDLNTARKQELKNLLLEHTATTLGQIISILDNIMQKLKYQGSTVTPPPSPDQRSPFASPCGSPTQKACTSPRLGLVDSPIIISNSLLNPSARNQALAGFPPTLDAPSEGIVLSALSCISQFFSWIPLSNVVSANFVEKLFLQHSHCSHCLLL